MKSTYDRVKAFFDRRKTMLSEEDYYSLLELLTKLEDKELEVFSLSEKIKQEGNAFFKNNQLEKAFEKYDEAVAIDPVNINALANRALVYSKLGNSEKATEDYLTSIDIDDQDAKMYARLASILLNTNPTQALNFAKKGLMIDPENETLNRIFDSLNTSDKKNENSNSFEQLLNDPKLKEKVNDVIKNTDPDKLNQMMNSFKNFKS